MLPNCLFYTEQGDACFGEWLAGMSQGLMIILDTVVAH